MSRMNPISDAEGELTKGVKSYVGRLKLPAGSAEAALGAVAIQMAFVTDAAVKKGSATAAAQSARQVRAAIADLEEMLKENAPKADDPVSAFLEQLKGLPSAADTSS